MGCIVDLAENTDIIDRRGSWYSYRGENFAQGRDNAVRYLINQPAVTQEIEAALRTALADNDPEAEQNRA